MTFSVDTLKNVQHIEINYMESCHSFIPNDSDFSKKSDALKHDSNLYTHEHYITLIDKCKKRKPFKTVKIGGQFIELDDVNSILQFYKYSGSIHKNSGFRALVT